MGLFNSIAGVALANRLGGSGGGNKSAIAQVAIEMLNKNGGLCGLLEKFHQAGLSDVADSWVSQDKNKAISADQISMVLGSDLLSAMAEQFGIDAGVIASQIAQYLPEIVNNVTPNGQVDHKADALLSTILGMLK
ncbi:MAG: YidB family protein [Methylophilaceae bacterium]|nr:YidB family protein [Methylophilaceae bacterium]MDG1820704.1 YidB family protein [Methylophilaceae bacterium]MDG2294020.1 YidB family protein [Methylophilaceae bacterium]